MVVSMPIDLRLIFIVGASRSGTTMLSHILGNNEAVLGLNELHFIGRRWSTSSPETWSRDRAVREAAALVAIARRSIWNNEPTAVEVDEAESLFPPGKQQSFAPAAIYEAVLTYLAAEEDVACVVDQTPRNIVDAQFLLEHFPEARVVHLVRDPRAVLWSQRNRWRQRWIGAPHTPFINALRVFFNYHPFTASRLWLAAFRQGKCPQSHPRYIRISFEDIAGQPEDSVRDLSQFLGISYDPAMLNVANVGSSHVQHDEERRGVSTANAMAWKGNLPVADTWICEKVTGTAMDTLGYEREHRRMPVVRLLFSMIRFPFHAAGVVVLNPMVALRMLKFIFRT